MATRELIKVPSLGETVETATLANWKVEQGDWVEIGDPLAEIETDKVTIEIPAEHAGVIRDILVTDGSTVSVGMHVASIELADAPSARQSPASLPVDGESENEVVRSAAAGRAKSWYNQLSFGSESSQSPIGDEKPQPVSQGVGNQPERLDDIESGSDNDKAYSHDPEAAQPAAAEAAIPVGADRNPRRGRGKDNLSEVRLNAVELATIASLQNEARDLGRRALASAVVAVVFAISTMALGAYWYS